MAGMKERGWIEPIVERVVGQVLDSHANQLGTEIVRRVMEEIAAEAATREPAADSTSHNGTAGAGSADLARAVAEIQLGTSQREILRALLDTGARYATRIALFVVKGSHATGWQGRGFANSDSLKDFALDESAPAVVRAIGERVVASAPVAWAASAGCPPPLATRSDSSALSNFARACASWASASFTLRSRRRCPFFTFCPSTT